MAIDMAEDDDLVCKGVILYDDIASAPKDQPEERRGTAGTLFNYKITGSYAEEGYDLESVCKNGGKGAGQYPNFDGGNPAGHFSDYWDPDV